MRYPPEAILMGIYFIIAIYLESFIEMPSPGMERTESGLYRPQEHLEILLACFKHGSKHLYGIGRHKACIMSKVSAVHFGIAFIGKKIVRHHSIARNTACKLHACAHHANTVFSVRAMNERRFTVGNDASRDGPHRICVIGHNAIEKTHALSRAAIRRLYMARLGFLRTRFIVLQIDRTYAHLEGAADRRGLRIRHALRLFAQVVHNLYP